MNEGYIIYMCKTCNKVFILLTNDVTYSEEEGRYITCHFHGSHRNIVVCGRYESIKECMEHDSYKRGKGAIKQRGWGNG